MTGLYWTAAALAVLWAAYTGHRLRRDRSALVALSALCMLAAAAAMAVTAVRPDVLRAWPDEPAVAWLGISLGLVAVWAFLGTLGLVTGTGGHPVGLMAVPAAAVVSSGLFQIAAEHAGLADPGSGAAWSSPALVSQLCLLACLCPALARISLLAWRFSDRVRIGYISLGMRAVAGGSAGELGLVLARAAVISVRASGGQVAGWQITGIAVALPVAAIEVVGATTVSAWFPPLARWLRRAWLLYAYWRLRPLWVMLGQVIPEVELPREDGLRWNIRYRLHRLVIEIRDAQVVLRPYASAGIASHAEAATRSSGLSPRRRAAVIEAAVLMNALGARRHGIPPHSADLTAAPGVAAPGKEVAGNDLCAEAAGLLLVRRAIRHSRIVRQTASPSAGGSAVARRLVSHAARRDGGWGLGPTPAVAPRGSGAGLRPLGLRCCPGPTPVRGGPGRSRSPVPLPVPAAAGRRFPRG